MALRLLQVSRRPACAALWQTPLPCRPALQRLSGELDAVWRMQSLREPAAKRDIWKRKVEQVRSATQSGIPER